MFQRIFTAIVISAGLAGCANTKPDLPPNFVLDSNRTEGLAVVSLTLTGKPLNQVISFEYGIRAAVPSVGAEVEQKQHFGSPQQYANWATRGGEHRAATWAAMVKGRSSEPAEIMEDGKAIGRLVALRLPAGEYEFYTWKLVEQNAYGEMEYGPRQAFSYRFSVQPGKAAYLGRLRLQLDEVTPYNLSIEDKSGVDITAFRNKNSSIALEAAVMKEKTRKK
ncbi:hypothetical protein EGT07_25505 [Herbaspirillum sp. HC18]|nr:hypothetical protein EGT07_25505 [Herbaspirillum sp. HC18]